MKNIILFFAILSSTSIFAQTIIIEEKFEEKNSPVGIGFFYNSNEIVIEKGNYYPGSSNRNINNIYSYNSKGDRTTIIENVDLMYSSFSKSNTIFKASEFSKLRGNYQYNFYSKGKISSPFLRKNYDSFSDKQILGHNFNDKYLIYLSNEKGKDDLDLLKHEIYIELTEIFTNKRKRVKLDNINIERLTTENNIKYKEELGFTLNIINSDTLEIVTKSISKDYKSTTLYRSIYDFNGKFIKEFIYEIQLKNDYLNYSNTGSTYTKRGKNDDNVFIFGNDLAINNYTIDQDENVYIYGTTVKKAKPLNNYNETDGFYVYKFDKNGKLLWDKQMSINDPKDLNKKFPLDRIYVSLLDIGENVALIAGTQYSKEYYHYSVFNKNDGVISKTNKIEFSKRKMGMNNYLYSFIPQFFNLPSNENIHTNEDGLVLADYDISVQKYISSLNPVSDVYMMFISSDKGIWLIESDNKTYYKVIFF